MYVALIPLIFLDHEPWAPTIWLKACTIILFLVVGVFVVNMSIFSHTIKVKKKMASACHA